VVNDVSGGQVFGQSQNAVVVLTSDGAASDVLEGSKDAVAAGIWTVIAPRLSTADQG
jgi:phosphopantothenoylcysteine decarboxylase/phosphopantothenate--cysteine ligase